MYDIYKVVPTYSGSLSRTLIAGNYSDWRQVANAIFTLQSLVMRVPKSVIPVFEVHICTHRETSLQYKVLQSHTAPEDESELRLLYENQ